MSTRLTACRPRWQTIPNWSSPSLFAVGVTFDCPVCAYPVGCYFTPSVDPDKLQGKYQWPDFPAPDGQKQWRRGGDTFDTLTLDPSINNNAAGCGHWTLSGGELHESAPHGPRCRRLTQADQNVKEIVAQYGKNLSVL